MIGNENFCVVRKVSLPAALLEEIKSYMASIGKPQFSNRDLIMLCMERLERFGSLFIGVSDIQDYLKMFSVVFSDKTISTSFCFRNSYWQRINEVQNQYNIGAGDIIRLLLASCLFDKGKMAIRLPDFAESFLTCQQAYQYNMIIPPHMSEKLVNASGNILPATKENVIRAAYFYYAKGIGKTPLLRDENQYRVDNMTVGWKRLTVSGNIDMRNYYRKRKKETGKPLWILMAHNINTFLAEAEGEIA